MPVPPKFHSSLNSKKENNKKRDRPKFLLFSDLFLMDSVQKNAQSEVLLLGLRVLFVEAANRTCHTLMFAIGVTLHCMGQ